MQTLREDLLADLKHLGSDVVDRVERSRALAKDFDPDKHLALAKKEAKRVAFPNSIDFDKSETPTPMEPTLEKEPAPEPAQPAQPAQPVMADEQQPKKSKKSFFDEIG